MLARPCQRGAKSQRPRWPYSVLVLLILGLGLPFSLDRILPPDLGRAQRTSTLILDEQGKLLRGFTTADDAWRLLAQPAVVDPLYLKLLIAYEDQRFAWHPGVDPLAVGRALSQWARQGRIVSGASTMTMQVARLLEPRSRTLTGKLLEMLRALQLEWRYDKTDILQWYLTLAPYGGNLQGLRAASLAYFGKEPARLTVAEAALLVALPQAPSRLRPDRFPERARAARDKVLQRMGHLGVLSPQQISEAHQEAIPKRRRALPFHAPHLARRLYRADPRQTVHQTFIDGNLQRTLEALVRQQPLDPYGSVAILVAENHGRRVRAYVGSADFFATPRAGQVDMIQAIRSPGSTLKPLIYGMGFDELLIHPDTLIDDVPTRFGDYSPSNFLHVYHGQLSVREALQRSLNIPAVALLERLGPGRVASRLRQAGLPLHWRDAGVEPGLPLVLGGAGATLEQLVMLYQSIAEGGSVAPLRLSTRDAVGRARHLLDAAACWYLARILEDTPPPQARAMPDFLRRPRRIAHKTGTSYGFRDAWALGFDEAHTVGVWVGRADGSPSPGRYGRNTAAPLLFQVFDLLPEPGPRWPDSPPAGVLPVNHGALPERLRYFRAHPEAWQVQAAPLRIDFPVTGTQIELPHRAGRLADLPLAASGGQRPLRWLVNGRPLDSPSRRRMTFWAPDGAGLARITVMDQAGQTASVEVWIVPASHSVNEEDNHG